MEQPVKSSAVELLCERFYDNYDQGLVKQRHEIYQRVMAQNAHLSAARQIALSFAELLNSKSVTVHPYDLLAGSAQHINASDSVPVIMPEQFDPKAYPSMAFDIAREITCYERYRGENYTREEKRELDYFSSASDCLLFKRWGSGHVIAGYEYVVKEGYAALERRIAGQCAKEDRERRDYLEALRVVVRAAQSYVLRYAQAAGAAKEAERNAKRREALARIENACRTIATQPASTFFEAVQAIWLLHEMILFENVSGSMSLGRLDQLLGPFYEKELAAGTLTFEQAGELIDALWLKFAGAIQGFQNVTVGGCDAQGNSAANDITTLCIRASRKLKKDQPLLSLRYHPNMPDACWEEAQALIEQGGGFPALFNDTVIIKAKEKLGVSPDDAWDYALVGCVEPSIGGREYSNTEELRVNWAKVLELMLNGGECPITAARVPLEKRRELDSVSSFEDFYDWFRSELVYATRRGVTACNMLDASYPVYFPSPLLSLTMKGCIENAQDAAACGTPYRFSTINGCGMANVVDSLMALKRVVFEERRLSLSQFARILASDYEGQDTLHAYVTNRCPKFGNDLQEPDEMMRDLAALFCETINSRENCRGGRFQTGLYTVDHHASMGKLTGALPDGKRRGVSLANAISPVQGADRAGPTATMNSITALDHTELGNGMVLDLKFNPSFFKNPSHKAAFRQMVEVYFDNGGMEVQFNVIDRETLLDAQRNPSQYKNLIVRVSGFSAYFVTLDTVLQNEIIQRTEYNAI